MPSACAMAWAGTAVFSLGPLPWRLRVFFTGACTGVIGDSDSLQSLVRPLPRSIPVRWTASTLVGRHWLLGEFKLVQDAARPSAGAIRPADAEGDPWVGENENNFFFNVLGTGGRARLWHNIDPIVTVGMVETLPPVNACFAMPDSALRVRVEGPAGWGRRRLVMRFTECAAVTLPERNIALRVEGVRDGDNGERIIAIAVTNATRESAQAAYFVVSDQPELTLRDDFGLLAMAGGETVWRHIKIRRTGTPRASRLRVYATIYAPSGHAGYAQENVTLPFDGAPQS